MSSHAQLVAGLTPALNQLLCDGAATPRFWYTATTYLRPHGRGRFARDDPLREVDFAAIAANPQAAG
ncbi:MAG: hypothetical protein U1B80_06485 [Anaerolineaceae bacterium]|nr:hypothetical protein [Anaerolineaceae bacterium]